MLSFFSSLILAFSYAHVKNNSSGFFFSIFMSLSFINFIFLAFPPGSFFVMPPCFYTISQSHQLLPLLCDSSIICSQFGLCLLLLCTFFPVYTFHLSNCSSIFFQPLLSLSVLTSLPLDFFFPTPLASVYAITANCSPFLLFSVCLCLLKSCS